MDDNYLELQKQINELKAEVERLKTLELNYVSKLAVGSTTVPAAGGLSVVAGVASSGAGTPIYLNAGGGGSGANGGDVVIGAGQNGSGGSNGTVKMGIANATGTGLQATKFEINSSGDTTIFGPAYIEGPLFVDYSMFWQRNVTEVALNLSVNDAGANAKTWRWDVVSNYIDLDAVNDAYTAANTAIRFYRSGYQPTSVAFLGTGDVYSTAWNNYGSSSTITGWSSLTTNEIWYKRLGKTVFVQFAIAGTSNSANTSFTLPYASSTTGYNLTVPIVAINNGTVQTTSILFNSNSSGFSCYTDVNGGSWVNSGQKVVRGQFFYEAA